MSASLQNAVRAWQDFIANEWDEHREECVELANDSRPSEFMSVLDEVASMSMFSVLAIRGSSCRDELQPLVRFADAVAQFYAQHVGAPEDIAWNAMSACDLLNALQCVGCPVSPASVKTMGSWLKHIEASRDDDPGYAYWPRGFAALALGQRDVYCAMLAHEPDTPVPFESAQRFGVSLYGLLQHLAGALEHQASVADVMPAWRDLLSFYPHIIKASEFDNKGLLWVARVIHHQVGGHPLAEVADFFRDSIVEAAVESPD